MTDKLNLTEEKVKLSEANRELDRKAMALEKRNDEIETLLAKKQQEINQQKKDLEIYKFELKGTQSQLMIAEEKMKTLEADNVEYVKQILQMKETMATVITDLNSGKISKNEVQ